MSKTRIVAVIALVVVKLVATDTLRANERIHKAVKQATVLIMPNGQSSGSGALIDAQRRIVVTNAHVVSGHGEVAVFAPLHNTRGEIWKRNEYRQEFTRLQRLGYATVGRVISYSEEKDLAIVQLQGDLRDLREIDFADEAPQRGDGLHIVGNPADRPLFSYTYGGVLDVGRYQNTFSDGQKVDAEVIRFSGHVWYGNSGGPVANDDGELVGIVSSKGEATGTAIDVSEVRGLLATIRSQRVVSVLNDTNHTVKFSVRNANGGEWVDLSLDSGYSYTWTFDDDEKLELDYDQSFDEGYQASNSVLTGNSVLVGNGVAPNRQNTRTFAFQPDRNGIAFFLRN